MNNTYKTPKISIVVASHRPEWIISLCDNLLSQEFKKDEFEVIIVSDYPNKKFSDIYSGIRWFYISNKSISVKRNEGIRRAQGKYIAFTDDDCIPSKNWLKTGFEYLQNNKHCCGVEGYTSIENVKMSGRMIKEYARLERPGYRTNNIFYRKSDLLEVDLFDTRFLVQREDIDIAFSLITKGKIIDYCNDIRVIHRFRSLEQWDLLKNCWNRRFDPLLYKKHPELYRKHIKTPIPRTIVLLLFLWVLFPFTILCGVKCVNSYTGIAAVFLSGLGIQRIGRNRLTCKIVLSEIVSLMIAPLIIIFALLYGSITFKKILIY